MSKDYNDSIHNQTISIYNSVKEEINKNNNIMYYRLKGIRKW